MLENYNFSSLTVFILASTETDLLRKTVERVLATCGYDDLDRIVIALKSSDCPSAGETAKIIEETGNNKIEAYIQKGRGLERCLAELPPLALGSHFIILSADLEMNPDSIADMLRAVKAQPSNIVCASKWLSSSSLENYGAFRAFCTRSLNRFTSLLYGTSATDLFSFFQVFPTEAYRLINFSTSTYFMYEYTLKPLRMGIGYTEVPTLYKRKENGKSNFGALKLIQVAVKYIFVAVGIRLMPKRWLKK